VKAGLDKWLGGLWCDWNDPPEAMAFERSLGEILELLGDLVARLRASGAPGPWDCLTLCCTVPALVNVALNHMISLEHGLPLHPTLYFPIDEAGTHGLDHPPEARVVARALFLEAIDVARGIISLEDGVEARLSTFRSRVPEPILAFRYTSTRDRYTWRACEPAKLRALAADILEGGRPRLIVGAAHGSIMPGLVLAELLGVPLYFVRFSLFKRHDKAPILAAGDLAWLAAYAEGPAILFDEDVAKGLTLTLFTRRLGPLFKTWRSAAVIRHGAAAFLPDHVGCTWRG